MPAENLTQKIELRKRLMRRLLWKLPLIVALVSFAVWWQWRKENTQPALKENSATVAKSAAALAGHWRAEVTYRSGEKRQERFFFQPEADRLFGTATFSGMKSAIEAGKIEDDDFSFAARFEESVNGAMRQHKNVYWGKLMDREIRMRMQDDRGNPAVDFTLIRSDSTS